MFLDTAFFAAWCWYIAAATSGLAGRGLPCRAGHTEPMQRDRHSQRIADQERLGSQKPTDGGQRTKAETTMARYKRTFGPHLPACKLPDQQAEATIGVAILNRMIDNPADIIRQTGVGVP